MSESTRSSGFVSLKSITQGPPDPRSVLAELRHIYFKTTKQTIEHDFDHAIELLKSLPDEEQREKATVYMEGIAQLRREWGAAVPKQRRGRDGSKRTEKTASQGGSKKQKRRDKDQE